MRLKNLVFATVAVVLVTACNREKAGAATAQSANASNLLLRVQFAGTTAWLANTNATYLTNFTSLPETAALGTQLVAKVASLPGRFAAERGAGAEALQPVFSELLKTGFTLELRADANGMTEFAVAARETTALAATWNEAWGKLGKDTVAVERRDGWLLAAGSKSKPATALSELRQTLAGPGLASSNVLEIDLSSALIPGPIQRSIYGGFQQLSLTVTPANQTLKVHGTATYNHDLPKLGPPPAIPTNLVTETAISFTLVREPGAWLEKDSPLRAFLPNPLPDVAFIWGGEVSPYQLSWIFPFKGREFFNSDFGPALRDRLIPVAKFIDSGKVEHETNKATVQMHTVPFIVPKASVQKSGTNEYLVEEFFPVSEPSEWSGLTPALLNRISGKTNLVLYDWEYTRLRFDSSHALGQLALFVSKHEQLGSTSPSSSMKWIRAVQNILPGGGNIYTEITQPAPRQLTLNRAGALPFTSIEMFWLANWLESTNFPAANFLMPATQ